MVDTGPGVPAELHETIFEKFRQGNDRVSYEHGGTGLGLALSRALATLMGGTLTGSSEVEQGAPFTLRLLRPIEPAGSAHSSTRHIKRPALSFGRWGAVAVESCQPLNWPRICALTLINALQVIGWATMRLRSRAHYIDCDRHAFKKQFLDRGWPQSIRDT